jgi:crotonobetainyl-CoA:carnitine CoA-transferase CaiB-like acyl-CoA transferase
MIRTIVCDKTTAVFTAQAVSSALYARERTGRGDHIQIAMLDTMISYRTVSDSEWRGFCTATGDTALAADARFATPSARTANATARINKMQEHIERSTTAEWLVRLDAADVPCAPILRRHEVIGNEQVVARALIVEFDQPGVGKVRQPKPPARFSANEASIGGPAPRVGEHSREVLRELGYEEAVIDEMVEAHVVRAAPR